VVILLGRWTKCIQSKGDYAQKCCYRTDSDNITLLSDSIFRVLSDSPVVDLQLIRVKLKVKQSHYRPGQARGFQEFEAPRFQDNRHMKVVRLSALLPAAFTPGNIPGTHFC
jgi:hypothetical protein